MFLTRNHDGADTFFLSFFTGAVAAGLLWAERAIDLPLFVQGVAAGMILASATLIFINRNRDEFTAAAWHRGAAAGFCVSIAWLIVGVLANGLSSPIAADIQPPSSDAGLAGLTAFTAFILAIGWMRLKERL